jgi:hypothetical protein
MTKEHFVRYVKHFVAHAKASKEWPVVLLLDNHDWHLAIDTIHYCKQNDLTFLIFPPHCSNNHQPFDKFLSGSLTTYVNLAYDACITNNPDTTMTIYDIPSVVNTPFHLNPLPADTKTCFQVSEIHPFSGIFFRTKNLRNLTFQTKLLLL